MLTQLLCPQSVSEAVSMYLLPESEFSLEPVNAGVTVSVDQCAQPNAPAVAFQSGLLQAWVSRGHVSPRTTVAGPSCLDEGLQLCARG